MLIPGGQLIFLALEKSSIDFAYDLLDEGKWRKCNNRQSISPFYRSENPKKEYENIIKSLEFVDCHLFTDNYCFRSLESCSLFLLGIYFYILLLHPHQQLIK